MVSQRESGMRGRDSVPGVSSLTNVNSKGVQTVYDCVLQEDD